MHTNNSTQSLESTGLTPLAEFYKNPGKKIITKNGCMVNFHGVFFFSDGEITERRPWIITKKHGALPNAQEWVRLQQECSLTPVNLSENEEKKARLIAEVISQDPMKWLSKEEVGAYIKWRSSEKNRARKNYA